jgi:hypothetical protein
MKEYIWQLIENNLPIATIIIVVLLLGLMYLVWWTRGITEKVRAHSLHGDRISTCENETATIKLDLAEIKTAITYMGNGINSIVDGLKNEKSIIINPFTKRNSPISITEKGQEAIDRLGLHETILNNWIRIKLYVEENVKSMNPYDIQQFCMQHTSVYPEKFVSPDDLDRIKMDAYKSGYSLSTYMGVVAVLVRDEYFAEKGIDLSEVDKHDPTMNEE